MKKVIVYLFLFIFCFSFLSAYDFCSDGDGGSNVELISFSDSMLDNDEEWVWDFGESIEVDVKVKNEKDEEDEFMIELAFVNSDDGRVYVVEDKDDLEKTFTLGAEETNTISFEFEIKDDISEGNYDLYVKFYENENESLECEESYKEVRVGNTKLCAEERVDDSDLDIDSILDNKLENEDSWLWSPGDEIELELEITNEDYDTRYFSIQLLFFDEDMEYVDIVKSSSDLDETIEIEEDETVEVSFEFTLEDEIDDGDYYLYVKTMDDGNESICTSKRKEIEILDDIGVIVEKVDGSKDVSAGESEQYNVTVKNYGSGVEEKVSVMLYGIKTGIKQEKEITNLSAGKSTNIFFNIEFPNNLSNTSDIFVFSTRYEYDSDSGIYKTSSKEWYDKELVINILESSSDNKEENITSINSNNSLGEEADSQLIDTDSNKMIYIILGIVVLLILIGVIYYFMNKRKKERLYGKNYNSPNDYPAQNYSNNQNYNNQQYSSDYSNQ